MSHITRIATAAEYGESIDWSNDDTGNSGTVTRIRSFARQGDDCRRLEMVSRAEKATRGHAATKLDFCKVDGTWKILSIVQ